MPSINGKAFFRPMPDLSTLILTGRSVCQKGIFGLTLIFGLCLHCYSTCSSSLLYSSFIFGVLRILIVSSAHLRLIKNSGGFVRFSGCAVDIKRGAVEQDCYLAVRIRISEGGDSRFCFSQRAGQWCTRTLCSWWMSPGPWARAASPTSRTSFQPSSPASRAVWWGLRGSALESLSLGTSPSGSFIRKKHNFKVP